MSKFRRSLLKPVAPHASLVEEKNVPPVILDWSVVNHLRPVKYIDLEIPIPLVCTIKGISVSFSAELEDGRRISIQPVMPKNEADGSILAPHDGEEGYLAVTRSSACKLLCDSTGLITFSIRPVFKEWESVADRERRLVIP